MASEALVDIASFDAGGLTDALKELGQPAFRRAQIVAWLYARLAGSFDEMTDLPASLRSTLAERFALAHPVLVERQESADGTRKYLVRIAGGHEVEVVYIPETDRGTLCISSQVGCTLTCSFCHTGTQKLVVER